MLVKYNTYITENVSEAIQAQYILVKYNTYITENVGEAQYILVKYNILLLGLI